jgi:uncharacterized membrane protein YqhA
VSFAAITLCAASERVFIAVVVVVVVVVVVYFVTDAVRKLLETPSYIFQRSHFNIILTPVANSLESFSN